MSLLFELIYFVWVKRKTLCNYHVFFSFFCQSYQGLWNCKSVFLILKIAQYGDRDMRIRIRIDISISIRPLTTKFGKQVHLQDLTQMILIKQVPVVWHVKIMRQTKNISTIRVPMATKLGRIVTYFIRDPLITWFCQIAWQTKIISPLPKCEWPPNLADW